MSALTYLSLQWIFLSVYLLLPAAEVSTSGYKEITAIPGDNVILTCQVPSNSLILAVEWSRSDLEPDYVYLYRDGRPYLAYQHTSFKNRVELKDKQMKDGDVSLILKNVINGDSGTYECHVFQRGTNHRKRSVLDTEPITSITLTVTDSGHTAGNMDDGGDKGGENKKGENTHGHIGLVVSESFVMTVGLVTVIFVKRIRDKKKNSLPADKPSDQQLLI